jgi:hypothetical protein
MSVVVKENKQLKTDIYKSLETLQQYNITYEDIELLIKNKFIAL